MANRKEQLDHTIAEIHKRWGAQAIGRSPQQFVRSVPSISTGFPALDAAVGCGGIPRGRISELIGVPTSGMTSLALMIAARAQSEGGMVVYLDLDRCFDPAFARQMGVTLDYLILIHPHDAAQALDMLPDMVHNGGFDLMICDMPLQAQGEEHLERKLASVMGRLLAPLSKDNGTLLFLTMLRSGQRRSNGDIPDYPQGATLPHFATLRLLLRQERWLYRQRDVLGCEARVTVIKNKLSAAGKQAQIVFTFNETGLGLDP
jgi:recombination protein RecA